MLTRDLRFPTTWRISKEMKPVGKNYPNTYCTVFYSRKENQWLGELCLSSNKNFIRAMGVRDEVPEEEDWADRSKYEVGYWSVTPLSIYPMTPFILKPIKNYAAESDCYLDDGPVYRATSMCHTTLYELRKGVFIYSVFHIFDNVKRKQKVQVSDIRNLWIHIGKKINKESRR
ncbi:hypothetical protein [Herbaspirillum sp. B65]|uniref:hypothetical protein n=1 Tax=Herbaspirillum sp. B65 TaxID=137708 RepID=UPI0020907BBF|nr:hypothetical protein [Herbaspirillum sp. B65]